MIKKGDLVYSTTAFEEGVPWLGLVISDPFYGKESLREVVKVRWILRGKDKYRPRNMTEMYLPPVIKLKKI